MNPGPLQLVLTFDAEADVFDRSIGTAAAPGWRGIEEGIPLILAALARRRDATGAPLRATWFVRTDAGIAAQHGNAAYLLQRYDALWRARLAAGDEIGFHPHLSRQAQLDATGALPRAEIADAFEAVQAAGYAPVSSRLGEAFGSNAAFAALQESGLAADSTAMPGRVRRDAERALDWSGTPSSPYRPAVADYRIPGRPAHGFWEIPMTLVPVRADYDAAPLARYVDLSFHPGALRAGLAATLATASLLVTVTHPSTLLPGIAGGRHGLLAFEASALQVNLDFIFQECARLGRAVHSLTVSACARLCRQAGNPELAA